MRGLINIIAAIIVATCLHACRTHVSAKTSTIAEYTDSLHKVSQVEAFCFIDQWAAKHIITDTYARSWTKMKVYDTSKPGNPLLCEIEKKDSAVGHQESNEEDTVNFCGAENNIAHTDSVSHRERQYEKDKEIKAEERITSIGQTIAMLGFLFIIIYGLVVLYNKLK